MGSASGRVDTQPPGISGSISGTAGDNGWYVSDVVFSASASDASPGSGVASFQISIDGGAWAAYTAPLTLSEGSHSVDVRASDAAGNVSTQSQAIQVDSQPPTLALSAADEFCPGCGDTLEITIEVQDSLSGVAAWELTARGNAIASGAARASQTLLWNGGGLPGGAHTLLLTAQDAAGNTLETSQPVTLLVPAPPPASSTPTHPGWTPLAALPTTTSVATGAPTRTSQPTRTPSLSIFGGPPLAPSGPGASPAPELPPDAEGASPPVAESPTSGVLWGAGALALIGTATAIALDAARKRKEEEDRRRAEMEARKSAQRAREEAERARLRAAAEATAAAWVAERQAEHWQEEQIQERYARRD
jgi:hypothetical protein